MTKDTKGIITVITIAAIAVAAYHFTHGTKKSYAKTISKLNGSSYPVLLGFDEAYLKAWAQSLLKGKIVFVYNNATYSSQSGKKTTT